MPKIGLPNDGIEQAWIEAAIAHPARREADPRGQGIMRAFFRVAERGNRVLRVSHSAGGASALMLSVHFDRGARL